MSILFAAVLVALGLFCVLCRRTVLGIVIGLQLLLLGLTTAFVLAGIVGGGPVDGHIMGVVVALGGCAQIVTGFAFGVRRFYISKRTDVEELRLSLIHI